MKQSLEKELIKNMCIFLAVMLFQGLLIFLAKKINNEAAHLLLLTLALLSTAGYFYAFFNKRFFIRLLKDIFR